MITMRADALHCLSTRLGILGRGVRLDISVLHLQFLPDAESLAFTLPIILLRQHTIPNISIVTPGTVSLSCEGAFDAYRDYPLASPHEPKCLPLCRRAWLCRAWLCLAQL